MKKLLLIVGVVAIAIAVYLWVIDSGAETLTEVPVTALTGQVVDISSGAPLTEAQVCIQNTTQCADADETGTYTLSDLDAAEQVFEVSAPRYIAATQTIAIAPNETVTQGFALTAENPVLAVLPDNVVLRGASANFMQGSELIVQLGSSFNFLLQPSAGMDVPKYGVKKGEEVLGVLIDNALEIVVPNRSETAMGKAANDQLQGVPFKVTAVGDINQPLKLDDLMEVVLTDPTSSNPPYTVNFHRGQGEARQAVATFTINKQ